MSFANSDLATYLVLVLTVGRHWNVGEVSKLPWDKTLENEEALSRSSKAIAGLLLSLRRHDSVSPYYTGPVLLHLLGSDGSLPTHTGHPHRDLFDRVALYDPVELSPDASLEALGIAAAKYQTEVWRRIEEKDRQINDLVYDHFEITNEERALIETEIALRTNEDPRQRPVYDPDAVTEPPEDFPDLVRRMLLHLVFEVVHEDDDGIVLLGRETDDEEAPLLERLAAKFEDVFGQHADARLAEADQLLGHRTAQDEPYPNLRRWLEKDLFAFHCAEFENTPILWKLTSARLTAGSTGEGFACLVDYHRLTPGLFDRLQTRYLEPRKAALRQKQTAARQRSTDAGLSADQQAAAQDERARCDDALGQIRAFEGALSALSRTQPRAWTGEDRDTARALAPQVATFRERLEDRLATLDLLHAALPAATFKDRFSPKFMEKVDGKREEWLDALRDLEAACEAYARPAEEPVEAHLYDLFPYYIDKLCGTTSHNSGGILFLNHYFKKGQKLATNVKEGEEDKLSEAERLIVQLARATDRDVELGQAIQAACKTLKKRLPSDWKTRALEEVTTQGYRPVKKHGVAINLTPLAEAKIVPALVEEKVL